MPNGSMSTTLLSLCVVLMIGVSSSSCRSTSASTKPTAPPVEPLALAIEPGGATLLSREGTAMAHLPIEGLKDGFSVWHPDRDSVFIVDVDDGAWEISVRPELAARYIGRVSIEASHRSCLGASEGENVSQYMQSSQSIVLSDSPAESLCLILMDRNVNMMDVEVTALMNIGDASTTSRVSFQGLEEPEGACVVSSGTGCAPPARLRATSARRWAMKGPCSLFDQRRKEAVDLRPLVGLPANATANECEGVFLDGESHSGRFIAVARSVDEGDYILLELTLFDMESRDATPKLVDSWSITGETRRTWAASVDAVMIDRQLVILGDSPVVIDAGVGAQFVTKAERR